MKIKNVLKDKNQNTIFSIKSSTPVYDALVIMAEKNIGALLVVDNDKLDGIFSERDYARKVILKGKASKQTKIKEIMSEDIVFVAPENSIDHCMKLMTTKFIRHLPVVFNDKLIGIISIGDVVKHVIEEQKFIIENMEQYIAGQ